VNSFIPSTYSENSVAASLTKRIKFDTIFEGGGVIQIPDNLTNGPQKGDALHVTVAPDPHERWTVGGAREGRGEDTEKSRELSDR
jgi:hypothetical protein